MVFAVLIRYLVSFRNMSGTGSLWNTCTNTLCPLICLGCQWLAELPPGKGLLPVSFHSEGTKIHPDWALETERMRNTGRCTSTKPMCKPSFSKVICGKGTPPFMSYKRPIPPAVAWGISWPLYRSSSCLCLPVAVQVKTVYFFQLLFIQEQKVHSGKNWGIMCCVARCFILRSVGRCGFTLVRSDHQVKHVKSGVRQTL